MVVQLTLFHKTQASDIGHEISTRKNTFACYWFYQVTNATPRTNDKQSLRRRRHSEENAFLVSTGCNCQGYARLKSFLLLRYLNRLLSRQKSRIRLVIVKCTFVCVFPFGSESERQPLEVILAMDTSPCRHVL